MFRKFGCILLFIAFASLSFVKIISQSSPQTQHLQMSSYHDSNPNELPYPEANDFDLAVSSEAASPRDLLKAAQSLMNFVSSSNFSYQVCSKSLNHISKSLYKLDPSLISPSDTKRDYVKIIRILFEVRLKIHERMRQFQIQEAREETELEDTCVTEIRNIFRVTRFIEDYVGEVFLPKLKAFDPGEDPIAIGNLSGDEPWLMRSEPNELNLRSGDLILSIDLENSHAALSRIAQVASSFSQLDLLYVKDESQIGRIYKLNEAIDNPNFLVLQTKIGLGASIKSLKEYLAEGNARNLLMRYPDPSSAHLSAETSFLLLNTFNALAYANRFTHLSEILLTKSDSEFQVPYNYKMKPTLADVSLENLTLNASQIAQIGFHSQNIVVPLYPSSVILSSENPLLKSLQIEERKIFVPGDLELDTRFDVLSEWRDFRKLKQLRLQGAINDSMFHWIKDLKYEFDLSSKYAMPKLEVNGVDLSNKLPKNMTHSIAQVLQMHNTVSEILFKKLKFLDDQNAKIISANFLDFIKWSLRSRSIVK